MAAVTVPNAGTYDLLVDVGFLVDGFVLDDPVRGVLGGYATTTTRTNLVLNPSFETNTTGWTATALSSISRVTTDSLFGTASMQVVLTNPTDGAGFISSGGFRFPIIAGQTYVASGYAKVPSGQPNVVLDCDIVYYNAVSGGSVINAIDGVNYTLSSSDGWRRFTVSGTAGVGATHASIRINSVGAQSGTFTYLVDGLLFETGSTVLPYFDGTVADPYTGYTLTAQAWNGTTNNSTSTATWGLDSSFYAGNPLDGTTQFASVADGTLNVSMKRGRQDENDAITNGTMSFTLNDTLADGVFNPFDNDPSNPYYDQAQGVPGLAPGREVRLIRYDSTNTPESMFVGYVVNYDYKFTLGGLDTVTVFCVDKMYRLAQTAIPGQNPVKEYTGDRINWVLDLPEVDYPGGAARDIAAGTVELGGSGQYAISDGQNVKAYFDQITETAERGRIFIDREGVLVSQNRIGFVTGTPELAFTDDGTGVPYRDLSIAFQAEDIINLVEVTTRGSHTATASDATSQSTYFIKTLFITDSLLESNTAAQDLADYLLFPNPQPRFDSLDTWFGSLTTAQRDSAAILDLGSYISVEKDILIGGTPSPLTQDLTIEGVEHRIDFARGHSARYYTSPATVVYQLILDDPVYGVLDSTNVLG